MNDEQPVDLPRAPIDRLVGPLTRFLHVEATSGIVLLLFTVAALALANSTLAEGFLGVWKTRVLAGSAVAAIIGVTVLIAVLRPKGG